MLSLIEIFSILIIHFIADFIFQDEKWSKGKSKNNKDLINHTCVYSVLWLIPMIVFLGTFIPALLFVMITFVCHTITDYFTSRVVSKKFEMKHYGSKIPNFGGFTIIGMDQILHYTQLFLTYYFLKF